MKKEKEKKKGHKKWPQKNAIHPHFNLLATDKNQLPIKILAYPRLQNRQKTT